MGKWLSGSAGTGKKIMQNLKDFKVSINEHQKENGIVRFVWTFNEQTGYISVRYREGKISNSSMIGTDDNSMHAFNRPLGLYNDDSLYSVFTMLMNDIGINITGGYNEDWN